MSERLRALFCDHLAIMRGKYLPSGKIASGETRFCQSVFGVHYDRDLLPSPGSEMFGGLPDMELRWDVDDVRPGWEPDTKVVLGDLYDQAGRRLALCPRGLLKKAVDDWAKHGLSPKVGIELEAFAMMKDETGNLVPYEAPGGVVYGTGPFADPLGFNDQIWDVAHEMGFRLEMMTAEFDTPQFEYTLEFDDAVKAVDDIILFKQMAREVAFESGIILTFLPKPIDEAGGSGMHINFSFVDEKGKNAMASGDAGGPDNMNDLARGCVAGLVDHHQALVGLTAPTALSFQRLQPASLSGYWKNWGGDHRNVTTRVSAEGGAKARLEHRMADASSNPYIAVAAVLQAARLGFEGQMDLPPMETGDGFENNDATIGAAGNIKEAMEHLSADTALCEAVGAEFVANHIFMKEQEFEKTQALEGHALRDFYIWFL